MKREKSAMDNNSCYVFGREIKVEPESIIYTSALAIICLYLWLAVSMWVE